MLSPVIAIALICYIFLSKGEDRFDAIWNLLQSEHLPRENYRNIHYLFKVGNTLPRENYGNIYYLYKVVARDNFRNIQ